ncbi:MAG: sensor histidine kinase [Proteobacteria bacterium]|nr:sensor histidine kinase [Pseudomonadota bacterium]NDC23524.1 sensor histidine kinase [Pseudomonadota bacterium]NDD03705.1 sensor histidine kinase [Pseudomonadota bacterium]NDG26201.1 sensor histidine kinase [Pseudomonadota bacterium]
MRFRFTILMASTVFVLLIGFAYLIYGRVRDNSFQVAENYLSSLVEHEWEHLDLPSHQSTHQQNAPHFRNVYLRIWKEGELIYDSFPRRSIGELNFVSDRSQGKLYSTVQKVHQGHHYKVAGFYDASLIVEYLSVFRKALFLGGLLFMVVLIPISLLLTRLLLRPFTALAIQTSLLSADRLSFRLPESRYRDEFGMLARNFNLLFDRLEKSFNQIRNFAVNASHELRTPLAVVIAQGERVLKRPPEDVKSCLSVFQKQMEACLKLRTIINQLFALSEVERLGQENLKTEFNVGETVEEVIEGLQQAYGKSSRTISIEPVGVTLKAHGNREIFTTVLTNLLENALKYSQDRIRVTIDRQSQSLLWSIEDDGPGISAENREHVFAPFFTDRKQTDNNTNSHGLGLSIVKACIDSERGSINLTESLWGGLKIVVSLPWKVGT